MAKEKKKNELEQEEVAMEFNIEELEVKEQKEQKKEQQQFNKEKSKTLKNITINQLWYFFHYKKVYPSYFSDTSFFV